jgi:hypothetical protein
MWKSEKCPVCIFLSANINNSSVKTLSFYISFSKVNKRLNAAWGFKSSNLYSKN